jgi:phage-related baseplate assembly protein
LRVSLAGVSCVGTTTIGRILADRRGWPFFDLDEEIERHFTIVAGGVAATTEAALARVFLRRIGLLDSTRVLDDDLALRRRIEAAFEEVAKAPPPRPGPTRAEMIAAVSG